MVVQSRELTGMVGFSEFLCNHRGVTVAHTKRNHRSHIAEDRIADFLVKLGYVLVGHGKTEPVLSRLG